MAILNAGRLAAETSDLDPLRMARYREYLAFFEGEQWLGRARAGERRMVANYARRLLVKGVSYLMPEAPTFDALADDGTEHAASEAVEGLLSDWYATSEQHVRDFQAAVDAAVLGDGAFKVTWSKRLGRPVVGSVDPRGLWAWWWGDDPSSVYRVVERFELDEDQVAAIYGLGRAAVEPAPVTATRAGRRVVVCEEWTRERFAVEVGGQLVRSGANPYGWIPYVIWPNEARPHEAWGASDLVDLLDVCRELNDRLSTVSALLRISGSPVAVIENAVDTGDLRLAPGQIWELPEAAKAYLLDVLAGGGVQLHLDYIETLYRGIHDLSETPRTAFGDSGRALSGVALEVEIQPLVQKTKRKRRIWDGVYRRRNAMVLDLMERFGAAPVAGLRRTRAVWPDILPSDRDALVRQEVQLVGAEIHSRRAAMVALGEEDPEARLREIEEERRVLAASEPEADAQRGGAGDERAGDRDGGDDGDGG